MNILPRLSEFSGNKSESNDKKRHSKCFYYWNFPKKQFHCKLTS